MLDPNNPQKYEYAMIDISQTDSNKKHCMDGCINLAEQADNEIRRLQENNRELCEAILRFRGVILTHTQYFYHK